MAWRLKPVERGARTSPVSVPPGTKRRRRGGGRGGSTTSIPRAAEIGPGWSVVGAAEAIFPRDLRETHRQLVRKWLTSLLRVFRFSTSFRITNWPPAYRRLKILPFFLINRPTRRGNPSIDQIVGWKDGRGPLSSIFQLVVRESIDKRVNDKQTKPV